MTTEQTKEQHIAHLEAIADYLGNDAEDQETIVFAIAAIRAYNGGVTS